jgi:predicted amidohydrolase YtcJ
MKTSASLVILGEIVTIARPDALQTVEAIGIADGRIVSAGSRQEVTDAAAPGRRVIDARGSAVVPGLHDFHLHLVGLARARRSVPLADVASYEEVVRRVGAAARSLSPDAWVFGRGWREEHLDQSALDELEAAVVERPAMLTSHDGHSVWASAAARRLAGVSPSSDDPPGGRFERRPDGEPNGVARERAMSIIDGAAVQLAGAALAEPLREQIDELAAMGLTGATDAGDYIARHGTGRYATLGDSFSNLASATTDDRLRLTIDLPADAIDAAAALELSSGKPLDRTRRVGWAKIYSDGALGSRTAALFEPYSCASGDRGIMRVSPVELDRLMAAGRQARISLAIHAIGDRAIAEVLDAYQRAGERPSGTPPNRIEHVQLSRPQDRARFAELDVTASMQPLHCPSDRTAIEACWAGRTGNAYAWRSLAAAGARLAFGSDAPIEPPDPWLGMFAAVHRRYPDGQEDWHPDEALTFAAALSAYTLGPAAGLARDDEGHLQPGAVADLAVLNVDLATLLAADERLATVRSQLTLVGGRETHRS